MSDVVNSIKTGGIKAVMGFVNKMGRAALHTMAPDDFEYYLCSLELLDSEGATIGFIAFPVMPNNIVETKTEMVTITKTNSGIVSMFNPTFVPRDISIQGTFGRKLRVMANFKEVEDTEKTANWFKNMTAPIAKMSGSTSLIKTGYGVLKAMKRMVDMLYRLDENGKPHIMIFRNYALNTKYVVEIQQSSFSQSVGENMLWYYSLEMKAIADGNNVFALIDNSKILDLAFNSAVANAIGLVLKDVRHQISAAISRS